MSTSLTPLTMGLDLEFERTLTALYSSPHSTILLCTMNSAALAQELQAERDFASASASAVFATLAWSRLGRIEGGREDVRR